MMKNKPLSFLDKYNFLFVLLLAVIIGFTGGKHGVINVSSFSFSICIVILLYSGYENPIRLYSTIILSSFVFTSLFCFIYGFEYWEGYVSLRLVIYEIIVTVIFNLISKENRNRKIQLNFVHGTWFDFLYFILFFTIMIMWFNKLI